MAQCFYINSPITVGVKIVRGRNPRPALIEGNLSKKEAIKTVSKWNPIPSLNGKYEASRQGEIRNSQTKKVLKQQINLFGYYILTVRPEPNKTINIRVHQVVAEAFLGKRPKGYVVNHIDGNKQNNYVDNLEYVTPRENNIHALRKGLRKPANMKNFSPKGESHYRASINEEIVKEILRLHKEEHLGERRIAKRLNISVGVVGNIVRNRSWKHIKRSD